MHTITLQSNRARVLHGHPWAYRNEIHPTFPREPQEGVLLQTTRGRVLGSGLWNPQSQIAWRAYATGEQAWDAAFLEQAITQAIDKRPPDAFRRLIWSEADSLPGLVVDQFDDTLVLQALTYGVDRALPQIIAILQEKLQPAVVVLRNDAPSRAMEGLPRTVGTVDDLPCPPRRFQIDGISYLLDLREGQKTGFYLDQRRQHLRIGELAAGRAVLDGCCNQGAFALHAARGGASSVLGIDASAECIDLARENAAHNQLAAEFQRANLFDWFHEPGNQQSRYDLIVLDPPSFARGKSALAGALRGYKELNLRALQMLRPSGILATYSCSQHVSMEEFLGMVRSAAGDAGRRAHVLEYVRQPPDHPIALHFPESEYLCGLILKVE